MVVERRGLTRAECAVVAGGSGGFGTALVRRSVSNPPAPPPSLRSTFLFSAGGWGNTMFSAIESVGANYQPVTQNQPVWVLYFLVGVFGFNFFLKNLFIALVFETYMHIRSISSTGLWLSQKARRWESYKKELLYKARPVPIEIVDTSRANKTTRMFIASSAHRVIHSRVG